MKYDLDNFVWTTLRGDKLTLDQITDGHLNNIINLLRNQQLANLAEGFEALAFLQGEMAIDSVEAEIDRIDLQYEELISFLQAEQDRRRAAA